MAAQASAVNKNPVLIFVSFRTNKASRYGRYFTRKNPELPTLVTY